MSPRNLLCVGTAVILFVLMAGCGGSKVEDGRYINTKDHFSIEFPEFWLPGELDLWEKTTVTYLKPSGLAALSVIYTKACPSLTPDAILERAKSSAKKEYPNLEILQTGEWTIGGKPWVTLSMAFEADSQAMKSLHCYYHDGNRISIIACDAEAAIFDELRVDFRQAIESFRFE